MSEKSQYKTKQREQLLSYLAENPRTHFTAADICEHFRLGGQKIGTATVTVTARGDKYKGSITRTFTITKRTNPLAAKGKKATVRFKKIKKKNQKLAVSKVIRYTSKGMGTVTYVKSSGNKKITVNKKTGKVTVKKGLKKGTYKVKVKITASGTSTYKKATKTVTFRIRVK